MHEVSLEVNEGEIVTIVGANGAGKTTLLAAVSRLVGTGGGRIRFDGTEITRFSPEKVVRLGIGHVPAGRQLFAGMSVLDNLRLGAYSRRRGGRGEALGDLERIFEIFPVLEERRNQPAGTLSGGEQQMLAVGRALMSHPKLMLLDEPSMGLAPIVIKHIFKVLSGLHRDGLTVLLVEQDARLALSLADRGYVLQNGRVVLTDTGERLLQNEEVKEIYFGKRVEKSGD
ncbi:MAG: ABC transporter ATP-binding protein [Chloroflexi bacterium]|nr:ABC transporter ATP-binding protein [Chloroflexota bacterium]